MFLRDDRLVVITGDEPKNGEIAVFSLSAILELQEKPGLLSGEPVLDLENGVTAGRVPITAYEWIKLQRWTAHGHYTTLALVGQGESRRFKWGFVTANTMNQQYLSEKQRAWLFAWIEATAEQYRKIERAQLAKEAETVQEKPKQKKKKRKGRKKRHYLEEWY